MKNKEQNKKMGGLMALFLFGLFVVCIFAVLFTGTEIYQKLTVRDRRTYEKRTAAQYLTTKVRQADVDGRVEVGELDGIAALILSENIDGTEYRTWIYCFDGYIRELFVSADSAEAGEKVLEAEKLHVWQKDTAVCAEITAQDGSVQQIFLYPRSGKEVIR